MGFPFPPSVTFEAPIPGKAAVGNVPLQQTPAAVPHHNTAPLMGSPKPKTLLSLAPPYLATKSDSHLSRPLSMFPAFLPFSPWSPGPLSYCHTPHSSLLTATWPAAYPGRTLKNTPVHLSILYLYHLLLILSLRFHPKLN